MIQDEEFRRIFDSEMDERLARVESALLALERGEADAGTFALLMREAHSIKGSARLLGLSEIEAVAHGLEDLLSRSGHAGVGRIATDLAGRAYAAVDALRALAKQAVTGADAAVDVPSVVSKLANPSAHARHGLARQDPPAATLTLDFVRVRAEHLDALMLHAGELSVVTQHASQRLLDLEEMQALIDPKGPRDLSDHDSTVRLHGLASSLLRSAQEEEAHLARLSREITRLVHETRLVPIDALFAPFPRMLRDLALEQAKQVRLTVDAGGAAVDRRVIDELKDPLTHLLRNAIDHGAEEPNERLTAGKPVECTIRLSARRTPAATVIEVSDDGRGIDLEAVRRVVAEGGLLSAARAAELSPRQTLDCLFLPGVSTRGYVTTVSGRGVGLDAVRATVERLKGSIEVETHRGEGSVFRIRLPHILSTERIVVARSRGQLYGIGDDALEAVRLVAAEDIFVSEGRQAISHGGAAVPVAALGDVLRMPAPPAETASRACMILRSTLGSAGVLVDEVVSEQEVLVKGVPPLLQRVRHLHAAVTLPTGEICLLLNPHDLVRSLLNGTPVAAPARAKPTPRRSVVLLVEDSITTRTQEKRILEAAGFEVVVAVDGLDALVKLQSTEVDAVVTDLEMPRMDGFSLVQRIRDDRRLRDLPVILVTSRSSAEDRLRGAEVGADAYITKGDFDQDELLEALRRLVA